MLIETLTLCDFGLFQGEHQIDLAPRKKYGSTRPIILFGGLNGAGKTTILTAIRLAIYGRQALGYGTSQKVYEEYLASKIHRNRNSLVVPSGANVALDFIYHKLGTPIHYRILRSWIVHGKQIKESLTISQNGEVLTEFNLEQCQGFLNELIPLGVSELFFFDGEKIASLADEGGDVALRDAIRKLLGLDIIERLKNDLSIYVRRQTKENLPEDIKDQLKKHETEYKALKENIKEEENAAQEIHPKIAESKTQLDRLESHISANGGAWAASREAIQVRGKSLETARASLQADIREALNGLYPLSLAPKLLKQLSEQIKQERQLKEWDVIANAVTTRIDSLQAIINTYVPQEKALEAKSQVNKTFADLTTKPTKLKSITLLHDLAGKDYAQLDTWVREAITKSPDQMAVLRDRLNKVEEELANISIQKGRAPEEDALKTDLAAIKEKTSKIAQLTVERNTHLELGRKYTWQCIDVVRKMRKLEEKLEEGSSEGIGMHLARNTRGVLTDFAEEMTKRKIEKLELEFAASFSHLARKDDAIVSAKIDPSTFEVHLLNKTGQSIPKKDLSAGEKQIYAIAMLEALAITSGRKLPIIIDTPLGRLDGHHRANLVNHYFPRASHQVIILSTDTEVDKKFYDDLTKHISHSYQVNYDEKEGASGINEGYFWKALDTQETAHAS